MNRVAAFLLALAVALAAAGEAEARHRKGRPGVRAGAPPPDVMLPSPALGLSVAPLRPTRERFSPTRRAPRARSNTGHGR